ncbi:ATP-dependent RNA helicase HrpA [Nocardia higoensis]|uniref:ATP-dependent RNA helicase HrpA n=1 Tax=Nocardia higoensis TaxID=228599 RepID=A0ABS0D7W0_9NOCA|nr:ATP-dependent RNA helicase HrpA [Nocardia higoensis]MBF6354556.1 ATP-dependent RNA helicase HrpA [Nocardia higoensis]
MTRTATTGTRELRTRLANLSLRDEHRLRRRLDRARGTDLDEIAADISAAEARIASRRASVPRISYPEQLPVSARRDDIAAAIAAHQVVVVAGETGSGKTTQIPKICLELGRGIRGVIGHTQPRRLAARTVAERIAEELGTELGETVGFTVRFTDQVSEHTLVKLMTDGILLAEIQRDRLLRRYDTIIIDEAHERSLNIDFLLGYLAQLLPQRPDLKVIITSATIDPELFARHFAGPDGTPAPIVEVSGRSYPVEIRYRPLNSELPAADDEDDDSGGTVVARDPVDAVGEAVRELFAEGDGDVLVFLSGEREIRDTADALRDLKLPRTEIVPLYARLSAAEQHKVFAPHTGRRVVLATNVAETSLTVPGIRYVIDPGTARISRYSLRTKVQRLPIEPISQASARQRSGRCGRVADGICIRLYSEEDFESRPTFTEPEILRTNLAAVILQMTALGLGDIEKFPFVEAPDRRAIRDGIALLQELGALESAEAGDADPNDTRGAGRADDPVTGAGDRVRGDGGARRDDTTGEGSRGQPDSVNPAQRGTGLGDTPTDPTEPASSREPAEPGSAHTPGRSRRRRRGGEGAGGMVLTPTGREMAQLPVDPRMARMLVQANRNGCLRDVLVIVAALSIQDVRERPADHQQAADAAHARFVVEGSDFLAYLRLWDYLTEQRASLSSNQFRRMCRDEFLHYLRIREWQDLHGQLRTITRGLGWASDRRDVTAVQKVTPTREEGTAQQQAGSGRGRGSSSRRGGRPAVPRETSPTRRGVASQVRQDDQAAADRPGAPEGDWDSTAIHQSLLAGMLSHIGVREAESREFLGARGAKFMIFPGSSLAKKPPRWAMAAELVETSRLWGRMAAKVEPEWAERLAGHLVKRTYSEPHWSAKRGAARAYERVTLYGVPLVTGRPVDYGRIDPELSRELFIRHALVQGEWRTEHRFFHRNRELLDDVADLEHRARRRDILVDDEVLFEFYDKRIPADVVSARHFDTWWKKARRANAELLDFTTTTVVNDAAAALDPTDFPDAWRQGELSFPLTYQFEPGRDDDGVTIRIPVEQLAHVRPVGFDWLVPGMRTELVGALIKTLPKSLRRSVVPAPDFAAAALASLTPRSEPLRIGLARELSRLGGVTISPTDLDPDALPAHLRMTFAAVDRSGEVLASGKSVTELKTRLAEQVSRSVARATAGAERAPATVWTSESLGTVPEKVRRQVAGQTVTGYPALVPEGGGVAVRVLSSPAEQAAAMRSGTRALVLRAIPTSVRTVTSGLSSADRLALSQNPYGSLDALVEDCRAAAAEELVAAAGGPVREPERFQELVATIRPRMASTVAAVVRLVVPVLAEAHQVSTALAAAKEADIAEDVRAQLGELVFRGFISEFGRVRLRELPRYLRAARVRLEALPASAVRDRQGMAEVDRALAAYDRLLRALPESRRTAPEVLEIWWMIEELRVSLFAQKLGTPYPVSAKRIEKAISTIRR